MEKWQLMLRKKKKHIMTTPEIYQESEEEKPKKKIIVSTDVKPRSGAKRRLMNYSVQSETVVGIDEGSKYISFQVKKKELDYLEFSFLTNVEMRLTDEEILTADLHELTLADR